IVKPSPLPSPPGRTVVNGWRRDERTTDIPQNHLGSLVSSAQPTTGVQVVRPPPKRLDSLTQDARRARAAPPFKASLRSCHLIDQVWPVPCKKSELLLTRQKSLPLTGKQSLPAVK